MNSHKYSLPLVNIILKLTLQFMNFESKNLFRNVASVLANKELQSILTQNIEAPYEFNRELVFKIESLVKKYNKTQKIKVKKVNTNLEEKQEKQDLKKVTKVPHPISSDEWAVLCKDSIQNGSILELSNLEVNAAWSIFFKEVSNIQGNVKLDVCLISFLGQLVQLGHVASAEALHNFFHIINRASFRQFHNGMDVDALATMAGSCLLDGLELSGLIVAQNEHDYFGSEGFQQEYDLMVKLTVSLLDNPLFYSPFVSASYKDYCQSRRDFQQELSDIQNWLWKDSVHKRFKKQTQQAANIEHSISMTNMTNYTQNSRTKVDDKRRSKRAMPRHQAITSSSESHEKKELEILRLPRESKIDDYFAHNFLDPVEAHDAWKQAIKMLKGEDNHITIYKGCNIISAKENDQYIVFAIRKVEMLEQGAQGTIQVAQELFEDQQKNKNRNIYLCKSMNSSLRIEDFINEAIFLKLKGRFKATINFKQLKEYYFQFSEYLPGTDQLDVCYFKDEEGCWQKRNLEPLFIISVAKGMVSALIETYEINKHGFLHGDVKPRNFIINGTTVDVIDFGSSKLPLQTGRYYYGTPGYQAPELAIYGISQEVFSLGVSLAELLTNMNYQDFLENFMISIERDRWLQVVPMDKIKLAMSDVFGISVPKGKKRNRWDIELSKMIQLMTYPNPNKRPNIETLKEMRHTLKLLEIELTNSRLCVDTHLIISELQHLDLDHESDTNDLRAFTPAFENKRRKVSTHIDIAQVQKQKEEEKKPFGSLHSSGSPNSESGHSTDSSTREKRNWNLHPRRGGNTENSKQPSPRMFPKDQEDVTTTTTTTATTQKEKKNKLAV